MTLLLKEKKFKLLALAMLLSSKSIVFAQAFEDHVQISVPNNNSVSSESMVQLSVEDMALFGLLSEDQLSTASHTLKKCCLLIAEGKTTLPYKDFAQSLTEIQQIVEDENIIRSYNINDNTTITGTLGIIGTTTAHNGLTVSNGVSTDTLSASGASTLSGNTSVGGTFDVTGAATLSGNTSIGGTLGVTGASTLSGNTSVGGTLASTGDFSINTNKFNVTAASGNTTVAGTLGVTGTSTLAGNTSIGGTLGVSGATTFSGNASIGGTLGVTGTTTVGGTLGVTGALTASGGATVSGATLINSNSSNYTNINTGSGSGVINLGGTSNSTTVYSPFYLGNLGTMGSGTALYLDNSNRVGYIVSSGKYKDNIEDMQAGETLMALRPVTFTYKSDTENAQHYGLIAEEVAKIAPELVMFKDGKPESVHYHQLPVLLLSGYQAQQKEIDALKEQISMLIKQLAIIQK